MPFQPTAEFNPRQWMFYKTPEGVVVLAGVNGGMLIPLVGFLNPEVFHDFITDAETAYHEFVPHQVREAMEVLDKYNDNHPPPQQELNGN